MTRPGFECLYYTDCRPGQGLRGGAGFQFQAVSAEVTADTMALVQRATLYEPPVSWMREQRPVADYPPSLAHVHDGVYVTARGVYLGAEANGVREGNQFTHAVATTNPEAYGQIRPAQLWDASWWAEKPAASTRCAPIAAEPSTGPWGIDAVREWVLGQPDAQDWLTAVHSAFDRLGDPDRRRVLFVTEDPTAVIGWIAAGTLLLPQERALRVGFRVFAANVRRSDHDVLAVHPDWAGSLANPNRDDEFVVFNLVTGKRSAIEPTDSALHWVPRFLRADPDEVYDVVDAVELAQQFAGSRSAGADPRPSAADRLASAVVLLGAEPDELAAPDVLAEWLAAQPKVSTEDVAEPLIAAILSRRLDLDGLYALDRATHWHGVRTPLAGQVRLTLLRAILDRGAEGRDRSRAGELAPYGWTPGERDEATRLVERALDAVEPSAMDDLLGLAVDFDVRPEPARFPHGVARFVRWWADNPGAPIDPGRWNRAPELVGALRGELAVRAASGPPARLIADIREHWWPILLPHLADPANALDAAVTSAAVARGDSNTRRRTIGRVMGMLSSTDPAIRADLAWRALFQFAQPSLADVQELLRQLPTVSKSFADKACAVLDKAVIRRLGEAELDAVRMFAEGGLLPGNGWLRDIATQDETLRRWLAEAVQGRSPEPGALRGVSGQVLAARGRAVLDPLVDHLPLATAKTLVLAGSEELIGLLVRKLPEIWRDARTPTRRVIGAVALAYLTVQEAEEMSGVVVVSVENALASWVSTAEPAVAQRVGQVLREASPEVAALWRKFLAGQHESHPRSHAKGRSAERDRAAKPEKSTKDSAGDSTDAAKPSRFGFRLPGRRAKGE